jgi:hypothetical protein
MCKIEIGDRCPPSIIFSMYEHWSLRAMASIGRYKSEISWLDHEDIHH